MFASPTKIETRRCRIHREPARSNVVVGNTQLGYVEHVGRDRWMGYTDTDSSLGCFNTKTDAVRCLIAIVADPFWCYYGETWEEHTERIAKETK